MNYKDFKLLLLSVSSLRAKLTELFYNSFTLIRYNNFLLYYSD